MKKKYKHIVLISKAKDLLGFKPNLLEIKKYIKFLLDLTCDQSCEISIRLCNLAEMIKINAEFRHKNKPTDVLSFIPEQLFNQNKNFLGDILICVPVCHKQAQTARHSLSCELLKMLIHALVHLKGFDHERSQSAENVMSALEQTLSCEVIKKLGIPSFEIEK